MGFIKKTRFDNFIKKRLSGLKRVLSKAQATISYNFWKEINSNDVADANRPDKAAIKWFKDYRKDTDVQHRREFMKQGHLYIFEYKDPKYKDVLDFFDTQPLVLCLGQTKSVEYALNNIGINLHLLPPKVRRLVLFEVWQMFRTSFKSNLYSKNQKPTKIYWEDIKKPLEKYGIDFAIRSYIPPRQTNTIEFKQEDWSKAIWLPSAGYSKITAPQLEKKWREHVKKAKIGGIVGSESHGTPI